MWLGTLGKTLNKRGARGGIWDQRRFFQKYTCIKEIRNKTSTGSRSCCGESPQGTLSKHHFESQNKDCTCHQQTNQIQPTLMLRLVLSPCSTWMWYIFSFGSRLSSFGLQVADTDGWRRLWLWFLWMQQRNIMSHGGCRWITLKYQLCPTWSTVALKLKPAATATVAGPICPEK